MSGFRLLQQAGNRNSQRPTSGNHMKKFLWGSLALFGLVIACVLVGSSWIAQASRATLQELRTEISAAGDPVYYTDSATDPIPEQDNAYALICKAESGVTAYSELIRKLKEDNPSTGSKSISDPRNVSPFILKAQETYFAENQSLFELLAQASQCKNYRAEIDRKKGFDNSNDYLRASREAILMLATRANLLASRGDGDAAIEDCLTGYRILKLTEQEPSMFGFSSECHGLYHLGEAVHQTLSNSEVSNPLRESLETQLEQFELDTALVQALKSERAIGIQTFKEFHEASKESAENPIPIPTFLVGTSLSQAYFSDDEITYIEYMNECISLIDQPKNIRDIAIESMTEKLMASGFRKFISKLIIPNVTGILDRKDDATARLRALRILLAVQHQSDLQIESLPATTRTDPYTNGDMIARNTGRGWLVYSVGANLTDDSGSVLPLDPSQPPQDIGYGPNQTQQTLAE